MIDGNIDVVSLTGDITDSVSLEGELLPIGPKGDKGDPGFSPVVTTSKSGKTTTVKFETATGNVYAYIQDGEDGQGSGDMMTDVYDQNRNGIVDNAEKVNNHTVEKDVPANADFSDTKAIWGNITGTLTNQTDLNTALGNKANTSDLSTVATSGSYNDLSNKPTNVSEFTNDANYVTSNGNAKTTQTNVSSATFTNTLEAPMNIDLKGNTLQNGTPTPSSPIPVNNVSGDNDVVVCGKNFFNIQTLVKGRLDNGVIGYASNTTDLTLNENSFSFTTNANYRGVTSDFIKVNGTEYLCSCTTPSTLNIIVACYDSNKNYLRDGGLTYIPNHNNQAKISIQSDVAFIRIYFYLSTSGTITIENPQLEKGFTPTTYEAYNGTTYNIDLPVENLFDKDNADIGYRIGGNGAGYTDANYFTSEYIKVAPNTTYTIKKDSVGQYNAVALYTQNKDFISRSEFYTTTTYTFTTNTNTYYIRVCDTNDNINSLKVGNGTEITDYAIELNKIGTYQDYFYKDNDKWYLHKEIGKVVLDGTEEWILLQTQTNTLRFSDNNILTNGLATDNIKILDDMFEVSTTTYDNGDYEHIRSASAEYPNAIVILINKNRLSTYDRAGLNSWLNTHNVNIYYILATPTNIEITYTPLIEQLESIKNAMSKEGTTNVNQVNNDAPFMLDLSVFNDTYNGRYESVLEMYKRLKEAE